jgi:hypothetical protein
VNPSQAWQAARAQLQREMPKATFDTWVKDAELVSFEGNLFTLEVLNGYARDWLESRLTSTLVRSLTDIMDQAVEVRFIVSQNLTSEESTLPDIFALDVRFASLYKEIVRPNRKVVLPAYFLRHLPYLGPTAAWILVAFRQIAYLSRPIETPLAVAGREIARWAGISERTFWRELKSNPYLANFITLQRTTEGVTDHQGRTYKQRESNEYSRDANRYTLADDLLLTPHDHKALRAWLQNAGAEEDILNAIRVALRTDREEILPDPFTKGFKPDPEEKPVSVKETVQEYCTSLFEAERLALDALVEALTTHLVFPPKDIVVLTWYFIQNWISLLGAGPAWAITLLRDMTFSDESKGIIRKKVEIKKGWPELAWRIGVSKDTVKLWFTRITKKGNHKNLEWANMFVTLGKSTKQSDQSVSQEVFVEINEPLTPEDALLLSLEENLSALSFACFNGNDQQLTTSIVKIDPNLQEISIETQGGQGEVKGLQREAGFSGAGKNVTFSLDGSGNFITFSLETVENFVAFRQRGPLNIVTFRIKSKKKIVTNSQAGLGDFVTILKVYLNLLSGNLYFPKGDSENSPKEETPQSPQPLEPENEVNIPGNWELDSLLKIAKVGIPKRQELKELGVTGPLWVANLLFTHGPGQDPKSPLRLAIANLTKRQRFPDEDLEYLANLPPIALARIIFWHTEPDSYQKPKSIPVEWGRTMGEASSAKIRALISLLFKNH